MIGGKGRLIKSYLMPDLCYALWLTSGSITKATRRMIDEGVVHPVSLKAPSRMGIWWSAKHSEYTAKFFAKRENRETENIRATTEEMEEARAIILDQLPKQKALVEELKTHYNLKHD
jgi:hypothetical protein